MILQRNLGAFEWISILFFVVFYGLYVWRTYSLASQLKTSASYVWFKFAVRTLYFTLFIVALLGPSFGDTKKEVQTIGKDIYLAVDLSRSMDANDIPPSRLVRIQFELEKFVKHFTDDRLGIIIFSGEAFMQCPLTYDHNALLMWLKSLSTGLVPSGTTDFGPPLRLALEKHQSEEKTTKNHAKIIVLISDGEDFGEETETVVSELIDQGIRLFTLGIGTEEGGKIPLGVGYLQHEGQQVVTKLQSQSLRKIAERTEGRYFEINNRRNDVNSLIAAIDRIEGEVRGFREIDATANKYYYFLYIALVLMLFDVLFTLRVLKI
ncbi:MAG: VWA domain-containing protein [Bernardetiaceae bacterium]|nr:VWA domain-containing protein [Bernardetiaceae bacterium]